jgi:hypothetical protein
MTAVIPPRRYSAAATGPFGIRDTGDTTGTLFVGTPDYMAPE